MRREARPLAGTLLALACVAGAGPVAGGEAGLRNGDFAAWADGAPAAWRVEVGATSGNGPASRVAPVEGGGLALGGDAATGTWRLVAQTVPVEVGGVYRLRFEARAEGLRKEQGQFGSAYVGLVTRADGRLSMPTLRAEMTFRATWAPCEALARATTTELDVAAFLSMSGRLEIRDARVEEIAPEGAFDALVAHVGRTYPFFAERGVNWPAHAAPFRTRAVAAAGDAAAFAAVLGEMLAGLKDVHVWIDRPGTPRVVPWAPKVETGFDAKATWARLTAPQQVAKVAIRGRFGGDIGYVAIGALPAPGAPDAAPLEHAFLASHDGVRGLVVDLRPCGGGDETTALKLAAGLARHVGVYARRRFRSGPAPDDFGPWVDAILRPVRGGDGPPPFAGPVVVILGPACGSSGEGLAQMLEVLPNVTTVGRPTRGASGNPAPIPLPGGIDVWTSRWQDQRANGEPLEGKGVVPQVLVEATGPGDPALDKALEILRGTLAKDTPPK